MQTNPNPEVRFWLVWNLNRGVPTHKHDSLESAQSEADRLADLHPGQSFYVMQAVTRHEIVRVSRTVLVEHVDLPF